MRFEDSGIAVDLPPGWQAASFRRTELPAARARTATSRQLETEAPGATTHPVIHAGSFALPPDRGDYGSGAVDVMSATDLFVSLVEFHPDAARTPLFARTGVPAGLALTDFDPSGLQRTLAGQSGCQRFFNVNGRAFCFYAVLGSHTRRHLLVPDVNTVLSTLEVAP
jgi:hypothetical protein